jgi:hypothetical protein
MTKRYRVQDFAAWQKAMYDPSSILNLAAASCDWFNVKLQACSSFVELMSRVYLK